MAFRNMLENFRTSGVTWGHLLFYFLCTMFLCIIKMILDVFSFSIEEIVINTSYYTTSNDLMRQ